MPIIVRQEPPISLLTRLAVQAGQRVGGISAGQALAMQERGADIAAERASQERVFELQRTLATQVAKTQKEPDILAARQKLRRTISQAEQTGIYRPEQISQMQIFADLGDEEAVRQLLGTGVRKPSEQRIELEQQLSALHQVTVQHHTELQSQLDEIDKQLLRPHKAAEAISLMAKRQSLLDAQKQVVEGARQREQLLQMGISIPQQLTAERQEEQFAVRQEAVVPWREKVMLQTQIRGKQQELSALIKQLTGPNAILLDDTQRERIQEQISALQTEINTVISGQEQPASRKATDAEKAQAIIQANGDLTKARQILQQAGLEE